MAVEAIWKKSVPLGPVDAQSPFTRENTLGAYLGLQITEIGPDYLRGRLPVDARTVQQFGRLHGGASCVLAEELGSVAANLCLAAEREYAVGIEINANHLRAARDGHVHGTARPLHLGHRTQVWDIHIRDDRGKMICVSRLTVAVISENPGRLPSPVDRT